MTFILHLSLSRFSELYKVLNTKYIKAEFFVEFRNTGQQNEQMNDWISQDFLAEFIEFMDFT